MGCPKVKIDGVSKPVSRLFYGTASAPMLAGECVDDILDAAYEYGINAFDTARGYGFAERSLGDWINKNGNREDVVVLSKCGDLKNGIVKVDRQVIIEELNKSLDLLRSDYIDIYLLHRDDPNTSVQEFIDTLNEVMDEGKVRVIGVSNWTIDRIKEANEYAASKGLKGFTVSSPNYGLGIQVNDLWGGGCISISGEEKADDRKWYKDKQMPIVAYSSLARGFFSGRFKSGDVEGARAFLDEFAQVGYLCDENMERLSRAEKLAEKYNTSVSSIAMRYIFSSDMNVFGVVSSLNINRIKENVDAASHILTKDDVIYLETGK